MSRLAVLFSLFAACGGGSGGGGVVSDVDIAQNIDGSWDVTVTVETTNCISEVAGQSESLNFLFTTQANTASVTLADPSGPFVGTVAGGVLRLERNDANSSIQFEVTINGSSLTGTATESSPAIGGAPACITTFVLTGLRSSTVSGGNCIEVIAGTWTIMVGGAPTDFTSAFTQTDCTLTFVARNGADTLLILEGEAAGTAWAPDDGGVFGVVYTGWDLAFSGDPATSLSGTVTDLIANQDVQVLGMRMN